VDQDGADDRDDARVFVERLDRRPDQRGDPSLVGGLGRGPRVAGRAVRLPDLPPAGRALEEGGHLDEEPLHALDRSARPEEDGRVRHARLLEDRGRRRIRQISRRRKVVADRGRRHVGRAGDRGDRGGRDPLLPVDPQGRGHDSVARLRHRVPALAERVPTRHADSFLDFID